MYMHVYRFAFVCVACVFLCASVVSKNGDKTAMKKKMTCIHAAVSETQKLYDTTEVDLQFSVFYFLFSLGCIFLHFIFLYISHNFIHWMSVFVVKYQVVLNWATFTYVYALKFMAIAYECELCAHAKSHIVWHSGKRIRSFLHVDDKNVVTVQCAVFNVRYSVCTILYRSSVFS